MECSKCEKDIPDDSKFCTYCGAKVEITNNVKEDIVPIDNPVNGKICSSCGEPIGEFDGFCGKCGKSCGQSFKEKRFTKSDRNSLIQQSAFRPLAILLPICLFLGFLLTHLGFDNIIVLPVFLIGYPVLCYCNYKHLKRKFTGGI
jgi:predicted amidophosphoribosyltransferase